MPKILIGPDYTDTISSNDFIKKIAGQPSEIPNLTANQIFYGTSNTGLISAIKANVDRNWTTTPPTNTDLTNFNNAINGTSNATWTYISKMDNTSVSYAASAGTVNYAASAAAAGTANYANYAGSATISADAQLHSTNHAEIIRNNLPLAAIGSLDFLDLDVSAAFQGSANTALGLSYIIFDESYQKVFGLRCSTNYEYSSLYYFYFNNINDVADPLAYVSTDIEYKPEFLSASQHFDAIYTPGKHGFLARMRDDEDPLVPQYFYYWVNTNGHIDPVFHTFVDVTLIYNASFPMDALTYCKEKDIYIVASYGKSGYSGKIRMSFYNSSFTLLNQYDTPYALSFTGGSYFINGFEYTASTPHGGWSWTNIEYSIYNTNYIEVISLCPIYASSTIRSSTPYALVQKIRFDVVNTSIAALSLTEGSFANTFLTYNDPVLSRQNFTTLSQYGSVASFFDINGKTIRQLKAASSTSPHFSLYLSDYETFFDNNLNIPVGVVTHDTVYVIPEDSSYLGKTVRAPFLARESKSFENPPTTDYIMVQGESKKYGSKLALVEGFPGDKTFPDFWQPTKISLTNQEYISHVYYYDETAKFVSRNIDYDLPMKVYNSINAFNLNSPAITYTHADINIYNATISGYVESDSIFIGNGFSAGDYNFSSYYIDVVGSDLYLAIVWGAGILNTKSREGMFVVKCGLSGAAITSLTKLPSMSLLLSETNPYSSLLYKNTTKMANHAVYISSNNTEKYNLALFQQPTTHVGNTVSQVAIVRMNSSFTSITFLNNWYSTTAYYYLNCLSIHPNFGLVSGYMRNFLSNSIFYRNYNKASFGTLDEFIRATFTNPSSYGVTERTNFITIKSSLGYDITYGDMPVFINGGYAVIPSATVTGLEANKTYYFYVNSQYKVVYYETEYKSTQTLLKFGKVITDNTGIAYSEFYKVVLLKSNIYAKENQVFVEEDMFVSGNVTAKGFYSNSSVRYKNNINTIENALDKTDKLRGVSYNLKSNNQPQIGLIAEETFEILPEVVNLDKEGRPDSINYPNLVALLVEDIKDLRKEIIALKIKVAGN